MSINYESIELSTAVFSRILRWSNHVNCVEVLDVDSSRFVPLRGVGDQWHRHPELEITLVTSGSGIRVVGDELSEISEAGNLVLLGRELPHYWKFDGPSTGICVQWDADRLMSLVADRVRLEIVALVQRAAVGLDYGGLAKATAARLLRRLAGDDQINQTERLGLFLQLIGHLAEVPSDCVRQISTIRYDGKIANANYVAIQQAIGWIMVNFQSEIRLDDVLQHVHMSKASFSRHFLTCTGQTFIQFVNEVRVAQACQLIHSSQKSISAIALESGFVNLSNFNRKFRDRRGMSPSQYRKSI